MITHELLFPKIFRHELPRSSHLAVASEALPRTDKSLADYDPLYDLENEKELSCEKDFPFEPKTVIVILTPMDYDCISTAPAWTADGTAADGYSQMGVKATQMAKFILRRAVRDRMTGGGKGA